MLTAFLTGIGTQAGLIIAIGSQNTFVLTQGIKKQYHLSVALVCALCDTVLISAGIAGMGSLIKQSELLVPIAACGGAVFLIIYGAASLRSALKPSNGMENSSRNIKNRKEVIIISLTLTLLNPHVYLDTVVLLGGISGTFKGSGRWLFGIGSITMSYIWFFALAIGAGKLSPLFKKQLTWRIMDGLIFIVMWFIAFKLIMFSGIIQILF
ncbi:MAG: LysE/ArgO family amino acid transporter [Spirochaetales bacterium]|nr:LysE/ArgO family amino acid transporter [Spirochaetales bacterium]